MRSIIMLKFIGSLAMLLLIVQESVAELTAEQGKEAMAKCRKGTTLEKVSDDDLFNTDVEPCEEIKCFLRCYMMELKHMNADGEFTYKAEDVDAAVKECSVRKEEDHCQRAYNFVKCVKDMRDKTNN